MSPAAITRQPSDALQTNSSSQPQRQSPSVVNVADACPSKPLMVARTHQPARPPTGHHNCRRPDSVIVALHSAMESSATPSPGSGWRSTLSPNRWQTRFETHGLLIAPWPLKACAARSSSARLRLPRLHRQRRTAEHGRSCVPISRLWCRMAKDITNLAASVRQRSVRFKNRRKR